MSDIIQPCAGLMGVIFGHKFEARYSSSAPTTNVRADRISPSMLMDIMEASKKHTYNGDVCQRCGEIINRSQP